MRILPLLVALAPWGLAPASATTLEDAIAAALSTSPIAARADAERDAAAARRDSAEGALLPTVQAMASIGAGRLDPSGYFGLQAADTTPRMVRAGIEQPLYAGGRIAAGKAAARAGEEAAGAARAFARAQLASDVAAAFSAVVVAGTAVRLREAQLLQMREIERQAGLRFRAGEIPLTDLAQARTRLAEAEAGLSGAHAEAAAARARFTALTGLPADGVSTLPRPPALPETRDAAVSAALASNPALAAAGRQADAAQAGVRLASAERLPVIGAFAEASAVRDQFFPDYTADEVAVGVRARWTLFDGTRPGRVAEARAQASAARAGAEALRRQLEADTIAAWEGLAAARRTVEATERQQAAAAEMLRATQLEARVGMKPQLALLDAERDSLEASLSAARARGELLVAAWRLKALTGQ
ncbi:TolC family protein [Thermaurantiacus sp.]